MNQTNIIALSTAPGIGALSVIRLSGPDVITICSNLFSKDLAEKESHTLHFGMLNDEEGKVVDEVVIGLFKGPNSFTGEDIVEISCHGSSYIVQQIIALFLRNDVELAKPGEFTMRAFLNGKMDLSQAEAVADLIASQTEGAHRIALTQLRGGVSNQISELRTKLIDFASLIELELDFSEEDVEFADRTKLKELVRQILDVIEQLIGSFALGNAIKNGVNTVIAGRPNAGKSTLLNALLNEERAIVSHIAGTTRDTIEEVLNIEGVAFRLIDTAGIREAHDQIEAIGVERTMEKIEQSAILVYVFDVTELFPEHVWADLAKILTGKTKVIAVANKMDLHPHAQPEDYISDILPAESIITASAKNRMNIEYLKEKLYKIAVGSDIQSDIVISNARHVDALSKSKERLEAVLNSLDTGITSDFVAMDIRQALYHLGEITGEISSDDLLGNIFGKFCIGK